MGARIDLRARERAHVRHARGLRIFTCRSCASHTLIHIDHPVSRFADPPSPCCAGGSSAAVLGVPTGLKAASGPLPADGPGSPGSAGSQNIGLAMNLQLKGLLDLKKERPGTGPAGLKHAIQSICKNELK